MVELESVRLGLELELATLQLVKLESVGLEFELVTSQLVKLESVSLRLGLELVTSQLVELESVKLELAVRLELELAIPEGVRLESIILVLFRLEFVMDESVRLECIRPELALDTVVLESVSLMLESVRSSQCPVAD